MNSSRVCAQGRVSQIGRCRTNLSFHRSSNTRTSLHRVSAAVASAETGIVNKLVGQPLLHLDQSRSVVPLLLPVEHQLPFAAALLVYRPVSSDSAVAEQQLVPSPTNRANHNGQDSASLVELSYILSGTGHFTSSSGVVQHVAAGDSILAVLGEIQFAAGSPAAAADNNTHAHSSWWNLVPWLQHHTHHSGLPRQHEQQQQQLVMLQLLLPSELLTGESDHYHPGHLSEVAQQLPWADLLHVQQSQNHGSSSGSSGTWSRLDPGDVCELLAGVFSMPHHQQQQQQQRSQDASGDNSSSSSSTADWSSKRVSSGHKSTTSSSSRSSGGNSGSHPSSSSSSSTLPSLGEQSHSSCVKRALSDANTFQLPAQTNRLALLFGPHASPAVCLSFGVEMFEPGHVTPLHTHSNAHELFFVLAGRGVAVHGPGGVQQSGGSNGQSSGGVERVEMTAGDVAVFPPGVLHGVDNETDQQLYCLQMMLPNESFVEWVRSGQAAGALDVSQLQQLAAAASCGAQ